MNVGCRACTYHTLQKVRASTTPYVSSGTGRQSVNQKGRWYYYAHTRDDMTLTDALLGANLTQGKIHTIATNGKIRKVFT